MTLGERELAVVLQAAVDHARQRLAEQGSFLPFGIRAKPGGEIEFIEFQGGSRQRLEVLRSELIDTLRQETRSLLAAALVATVMLPDSEEFSTAIAVQLESEGFCRLILVPCRGEGEEVATGLMNPQAATPLIYRPASSIQVLH